MAQEHHDEVESNVGAPCRTHIRPTGKEEQPHVQPNGRIGPASGVGNLYRSMTGGFENADSPVDMSICGNDWSHGYGP